MATQPPDSTNANNAEAGPSRPRLSSPQAQPAGSRISESYLKDFELHSPIPSSSIPEGKIKGTDLLITDAFPAKTLAEIHDPELLKELPFLFPPPQSVASDDLSSRSRPLWGLSSEALRFFPPSCEEASLPVNRKVHENIAKYHHGKHHGLHYNEVLMSNQSFKDPNLYSALIRLVNVDETRSHLPQLDTGRKEGSWRSMFPLSEEELVEADPIAITKMQEEEAMEKYRYKAKMDSKGKRNIDFISGSSSKTELASKASWTDAKTDRRQPRDGKTDSRSSAKPLRQTRSSSRRTEASGSNRPKRR